MDIPAAVCYNRVEIARGSIPGDGRDASDSDFDILEETLMAVEKKAEKKAAAQKFGDDRKRALEVALGKIEKDFGKGSVMKLGSAAGNMQVEVIPTGSLQLDFALGVGGLPKGRIVEIYGPESSGKTTVPPAFWAWATQCSATVVLPEDSGP